MSAEEKGNNDDDNDDDDDNNIDGRISCPLGSGSSVHHFPLPLPLPSLMSKLAESCPNWLWSDWFVAMLLVATPSLSAEEKRKIGEFVFDAIIKMVLAKESAGGDGGDVMASLGTLYRMPSIVVRAL